MTHTFPFRWAAGLLGMAIVAGCAGLGGGSSPAALTAEERYFVENVKPVLQKNCLRCHNGTTLPGKLNLTSRDTAFLLQKNGRPYLSPRHPETSLLVAAVSRKGLHRLGMPRLQISLTDDQIGAIREWIEDGAVWPGGEAGHLQAVHNPENP